jgi:L-seryl-tRNA(Ser) seleniumtransferase
MTLVALDGVLREYQAGRGADIPTLRMLAASADEVRQRAEAFRIRLARDAAALAVEVAAGSSAVGGGAAPTVEVPTALLRLRHSRWRPDEMARRLRAGDPPVMARIADDALVLDLRTVAPEEEEALLSALVGVAG